ncbi:MAG: AAA family ATPase, partial [Xanthomonadales bacterium]|nr:AAA family ATPase [Xanthomonadales bacterium]
MRFSPQAKEATAEHRILSKVSLFSGLNNLDDITVDPDYSALCGYTEADLDAVFGPELPGLDRGEIRRWYNGYHWTGETVYNPFDVLLLFQERQFRPWWFETATPTFLVDLLTERHTWLPQLGQLETDAALSSFDVDHIATEALLFQTGYLSIDREEVISGSYFYQLRYPNREVYQSLNATLLEAWTPDAPASVRPARRSTGCCRPTSSPAWSSCSPPSSPASRRTGLVPQQPHRPLRGLLRQRVLPRGGPCLLRCPGAGPHARGQQPHRKAGSGAEVQRS